MVVNGWTLFTHPIFAQQLERLHSRVNELAAKNPATYQQESAAKLLATIRRHIVETIPRNPAAPEFRQGNTLGPDNRHWFRAKFHERYRLFFRFSTKHKVIIYAWVNDESSLRKAGAKTDPYAIFREMLASGNPPSEIDQLLRASVRVSDPQASGAVHEKRDRNTR